MHKPSNYIRLGSRNLYVGQRVYHDVFGTAGQVQQVIRQGNEFRVVVAFDPPVGNKQLLLSTREPAARDHLWVSPPAAQASLPKPVPSGLPAVKPDLAVAEREADLIQGALDWAEDYFRQHYLGQGRVGYDELVQFLLEQASTNAVDVRKSLELVLKHGRDVPRSYVDAFFLNVKQLIRAHRDYAGFTQALVGLVVHYRRRRKTPRPPTVS